ncbi:hypothetical protein [Pseudomonas fluorescens]|uniref:hypothetical protein n=1 Tax=Pseudomonas fluorescens TaxID=294 RepID=UPI001BE65FF4|nr:hypothetical protein [Pseudomonas fluorescens]MBT2374283.1 hypothetical protein [Pseudomonas fluorescens]
MPSISPAHISSTSLDSIGERAAEVTENNGITRKVVLGEANDLYGVSRNDSFSSNSAVEKDVASRQVVKALRGFVSGKSHTKMIHNGTLWKDVPAQAEKNHIDSLSKSNLQSLRKELGSLTTEEKGFLERFFEVPLFATHSTAAPVKREDDSVALFSRQKLIDRNIIFNAENSPQEDIKLLGNDDFVFFALEAGVEPKKPSSRFGGTTFRFDFDEPVFKDAAWLSLVEMRFAKTPNLDRHIEGLSAEEYSVLSKRTLQPFETVFSGGDMKAGIGLSIIRDLRKLPPESGRRLLESAGENQINKLVNGMYRPEIKVARHFFSDKYIEAAVKKDDKS